MVGLGRQVVPSRPELPWMSGAKHGERQMGREEPWYTGMEVRFIAVKIERVLLVVLATGALPWVVLMPRRFRDGDRAETSIANASLDRQLITLVLIGGWQVYIVASIAV